MLKDCEIVQMQTSKEYKKIIRIGLKQVVSDLVSSGQGEFKPELSTLIKVSFFFIKKRIIRKELCSCSRDFLERIMNLELKLPRTPNSVKDISQEENQDYIWMRYDLPRVKALFARCISLMTDASFRNLVKNYSSITKDKNERLSEILKEIKILQILTFRSINTKGLFDDLVKLNSDEFYQNNEEEIQKRLLKASKRGALGYLQDVSGEEDNEQ